jgi:tRNA modification GTPase
VTLLDTAGIRESGEPVEQEGVRRARERAAAADLVLWVADASAPDQAAGDELGIGIPGSIWRVENKADLLVDFSGEGCNRASQKDEYEFIHSISAVNGDGMDGLIDSLGRFARDFFAGAESVIVTRVRHRRALEDTVVALDRALGEAGANGGREELIAEELRAAATTLGRLIGRVDVEDILDVIFRDFCIGK